MMKKTVIAALLLFLGSSCEIMAQDFQIIPTPKELTPSQGEFRLTSSTLIASKGKGAEEIANFFAEKIYKSTTLKLRTGKANKPGTISFILDKKIKGKEAYSLEVTSDQILAKASTTDGLFYAMQSLLQLLPPDVERTYLLGKVPEWTVPAVKINDEPRFAYRGIHLDPCRHFLPVEDVKRQIEMLAAYKINYLHWHITEDQGWRIEIKKYPKLTEIGARRIEGDGSVHEGYYTQEQVKDIVEFARKHHIQIIPELEIPGHELAAIAAYPELSCQGKSITPRIIWGVEDIVMCPGKEDMFRFLKDVIDEMTPLFPCTYFHIGGDESPRGEWAKCSKCQQRMKDLGYTKEAQLQSYVIGRVEKYLRSKGKVIIGWDEILEGGNLDTTAVVMSWRGESGGITAAKAGHQVLMTPSSQGLYFDHYQGDSNIEPCHIGGYSTLEKVYKYDPVPEVLKKEGKERYVLGVQANNWSEYYYTPARMEYGLYPRALALAEVGWSPMSTRNFKDFARRVDTDHAIRMKHHFINYHIPLAEQPGGSCNRLAFTDQMDLTLKTTRPLEMVYTTDGTYPSAESKRYTGPIHLTQSTVVKVATLLPCGIMGPVRSISAVKTEVVPGIALNQAKPGLKMNLNWGNFLKPTDIPATPDIKDQVVPNIEKIRTMTSVPGDVRNVKNYAASVEGYLNIEEDGIYEFSTNNMQLWIDDDIVIDNSNEDCLRFCRNNIQLALGKGYHKIKVIFIGGIFGGWPSYWDNAAVNYRKAEGKWKAIPADKLFHE